MAILLREHASEESDPASGVVVAAATTYRDGLTSSTCRTPLLDPLAFVAVRLQSCSSLFSIASPTHEATIAFLVRLKATSTNSPAMDCRVRRAYREGVPAPDRL
ncbi:MAG TPA: hypothetical protein VJQ54_05230 [Candidatus Sulfotelmatobacter sp.]|nr:hypothetical protein [Candidatus Sulfotelmatobacter sp.]